MYRAGADGCLKILLPQLGLSDNELIGYHTFVFLYTFIWINSRYLYRYRVEGKLFYLSSVERLNQEVEAIVFFCCSYTLFSLARGFARSDLSRDNNCLCSTPKL